MLIISISVTGIIFISVILLVYASFNDFNASSVLG
jgi:hypothetical protein